ncbi:MAG: ABC transporter permease [Alphaproteobacteria bacterium]
MFAGISPAEAVRYQLLIMFLIAGATGLLVAVGGGAWRLTDSRHRLRVDRRRSDGLPSMLRVTPARLERRPSALFSIGARATPLNSCGRPAAARSTAAEPRSGNL